MARHSHWHNIQVTKVKADAKRAKAFNRFTKAIVTAAKEGGGDPAYNVRLRVAIEAARANSVPRDNIDRAVARGTGADGGAASEEVVYEAFGLGKVALLIVCSTDNRNRTAGEVKSTLSKRGATVATPGSVLWMFDRKGLVTVEAANEAIELAAIDAGADDVEVDEGKTYIQCSVPALKTVLETLEKSGVPISESNIGFVPKLAKPLNEADRPALEDLLAALDDLEDVTEVFVHAE